VLAKVFAQLIFAGMPLMLTAPLLGIQLGLSAADEWALVSALLLGVPVFLLAGSIAAALTLGLRGGHVLVALLSLPLFIPALVFGAGAMQAASFGGSSRAGILLLGALFVLGFSFAPCATAAALRISLE
jgi:heme exporter protein B